MKIDADVFFYHLITHWMRNGKPSTLAVSADMTADFVTEDGEEVLRIQVLKMFEKN